MEELEWFVGVCYHKLPFHLHICYWSIHHKGFPNIHLIILLGKFHFPGEVLLLKEKGVFDVVNGVLVGKPQDEAYYHEYKDILIRVIDNEKLPIVYNVNFGHAMPRCALQYGAVAKVDMKQKKIYVNR